MGKNVEEKFTTPTKKEDILKILYDKFMEVNKECAEDPTQYNRGRYTVMSELLAAIKIFEKHD